MRAVIPRDMPTSAFEVVAWGARGSHPPTGPDFNRYGGATCCVELRLDDRIVVLDAGSGLVALGHDLVRRDARAVDIVISHGHMDHVMGLPFFAPLFRPDWTVTLWFAGVEGAPDAASLLDAVLVPPVMPFSRDVFSCDLDFRSLPVRGVTDLGGGTHLWTAPLNHPGGATGFRVEHGGRAFAYCSDFETEGGDGDRAVSDLVAGADLGFLDCTYTPEDYPAHVGFGHSDWRASCRLARAAGLREIGLFHHAPARRDAEIDAVEALARGILPATAIREGQRFDLAAGHAARGPDMPRAVLR